LSPSNPADAFVLDASVAAKWFVPGEAEPLTDQALGLLQLWDNGAIAFVVPDLFWAEIGSVLAKAVRRGWISGANGEEAISRLRASNLPTVRCRQLIAEALPMAVERGSSVYDSVYVALALRLQTSLITADERLVNTLGSRFPVRWLGSYPRGE
jgi:predicted nucleic acid-binding protein